MYGSPRYVAVITPPWGRFVNVPTIGWFDVLLTMVNFVPTDGAKFSERLMGEPLAVKPFVESGKALALPVA